MTDPTKAKLQETIKKIAGVPVMVVGDMILDRYVWGKVDRISPEAPVPVVAVSQSEDRLGGAGNVVRNLRALGAEVSVCSFIGDDDEGEIVLDLLSADKVNREGVIVDRTCPTILKTRVIAHRQQVVRIDRERSDIKPKPLDEALAALAEAHIESSKAIILSDYGKGAISEPMLKKFGDAYDAGRVGLSSRPLIVDPHPKNYGIYKRMSVGKPNRREAEVATGITIKSVDDAFKAAKVLMERWKAEMMVVTLGEDGLIILREGQEKGFHLETAAQEVFDVSGAGDTVTALFAASLAAGADPITSGMLANIGAGIVVSEVGTVAVDPQRLNAAVDNLKTVKV